MFFVGTSWKMNKTVREARAYAARLAAEDLPRPPVAQLFVCPPFTALAAVKEALSGTPVLVGAQNTMWADSGAYTGEISPLMLKDVGCDLVEIGHSERRALFGETDERVNAKVSAVLRHGMTALVCVGETRAEREQGAAEAVVLRQAAAAFAGIDSPLRARCLLAYEPVWAIGEGSRPARPDLVAAIHVALKHRFPDLPVLYGGSVDLANAAPLSIEPSVDGLFIGRAALDPAVFLTIARTALAARAGVDHRPS